jgi:hypothetical protein
MEDMGASLSDLFNKREIAYIPLHKGDLVPTGRKIFCISAMKIVENNYWA